MTSLGLDIKKPILVDSRHHAESNTANLTLEFVNDNPPYEPEAFYEDFGHIKDPRDVPKLADYQLEVWKAFQEFKRVMVVKSNKVGITTSTLIIDFQLAVLPSSHPFSCMGYDQLVIAQTKDHAKEHLRTLRKMIVDSEKYNKYLINKTSDYDEGDLRKLLRDDQTKTSVIYLYNPEKPTNPSRIIALGLENHGAILSWKKIKNIHISDATALEGDPTPGIDAAMTRLANTNGSMIIETIPSPPSGKVYDMFQLYSSKPWQQGDFKVIRITADQGVKAGVMTQEFLDGERRRLGYLAGLYYGASFVGGSGNVFPYDMLSHCMKPYPLELGQGRKIITVDPGFGSSKFAIIVGEKLDDIKYVKVAEEFERTSYSPMVERIQYWHEKCGKDTEVLIDGSQPGLIEELKQKKAIFAKGINFNQDLTNMTVRSSQDVRERKVMIHTNFKDLTDQLQSVEFDDKGKRDKTKMDFDLGDAFLLMCLGLEARNVSARLLKRPTGRSGYY